MGLEVGGGCLQARPLNAPPLTGLLSFGDNYNRGVIEVSRGDIAWLLSYEEIAVTAHAPDSAILLPTALSW